MSGVTAHGGPPIDFAPVGTDENGCPAMKAARRRDIARFACCAASLSTESCGVINSVVPEEKALGAIKRLY